MNKIINSKNAPETVGTYNHGVISNNILYTSGQIGLNPETMALVSDDFKGQANQVLINIKSVLDEAGCELSDIIKLNVFIIDMNDFPILNDAFKIFFNGIDFPARSTVQVSALPAQAKIEIDCIASIAK